jgi:hypothetical protein
MNNSYADVSGVCRRIVAYLKHALTCDDSGSDLPCVKWSFGSQLCVFAGQTGRNPGNWAGWTNRSAALAAYWRCGSGLLAAAPPPFGCRPLGRSVGRASRAGTRPPAAPRVPGPSNPKPIREMGPSTTSAGRLTVAASLPPPPPHRRARARPHRSGYEPAIGSLGRHLSVHDEQRAALRCKSDRQGDY